MDCSDEEGEDLPQCVSIYHLVNQNNNPISFAVLPFQWNEDEAVGKLDMQVYLRGITDDGLQFHRQVVMWKFELSYAQPEIWVLSRNKSWILLQNPRKIFKTVIRTILITVHWLHFLKKNHEASKQAIQEHLRTAFSSYEVVPSESDLLGHVPLIIEAAKRDKDLQNSKLVLAFIKKVRTNTTFHEDVQTIKKPNFIVDSDEEDVACEEADEEKDSYGLCAICDDGGNLLFCEGRCLRYFHATIASGTNFSCETLGYTQAQVDAVPTFMCKNCVHQQHQCFVCGMLGSSDKSSCQEVFPCVSATCGKFYHPPCVAKLLHPDNESQRVQLQGRIAAGESFTCPIHKCLVCQQAEDKNVNNLQFAMCRRCPKAYHRKCLPREIAFGSTANNIQRAWSDVLPNKRILLYCLDHEIIGELETPIRDHLKFPGVQGKGKKQALKLLSAEQKVVRSKHSLGSKSLILDKITVEKRNLDEADGSTKKIKIGSPRQDFYPSMKPNIISDSGRKSLKDISDKTKPSIRDDISLLNSRLYVVKPQQHNINRAKMKSIISDEPLRKRVNSSQPLVDGEMEKSILTLMEDSTSSFSKEEFMKRQPHPATHTLCSKNVLNNTFALGDVDGSVKAIQRAFQMLEEGYTVEEAKRVCEPEILYQVFQWKRKLDVYLAPFLHGMRSTSFCHHFTDIQKLSEIVSRLSWYVQSGDTIVDFSCGANDFSCLMRDKLEKMGKSCSFRNYDLFPPKDDFCFEKRDWMTVKPEELPDGSELIIGLYPPFGVKASLANRFISQALKFKPKLIVLIVPKETVRLDERAAYDLIWEDNDLLSRKSFYLPGSEEIHENQMEQSNMKPPPLFLWSRSDWSARHKEIAQEHAHFFD